jgi:hypothetical protein
MNYAPSYPAPTIVTQPDGRYYDDESSSASSAGAYQRHKARHDRSPQIFQHQQSLSRNNHSPTISVEQPAGRRSRSRTHRHRRSSEPHRHGRSSSRDESPARLPHGYRPASPDRHSHDGTRSRGFGPALSLTQNIPMDNSPPSRYSNPRSQPSTMAGNLYNTIPPQNATLPKHNHYSNRHRSSSHSHSDGYSTSRPTFFHRRSRSYDNALSRSPRNAHTLPQQGYGGYYPVSPQHQPFQTQTAAYPASGYPAMDTGSGVGAVQPSYSSPIMMHPPPHTTAIVPLNDGKDGWVVVPPEGKSVSVASAQHTRTSGHKNRDRHSPSTGSFFSRFLNFGKSPKRAKFVVPQQPTMAQPVQYMNPHHHRSRPRRDSY